MLTVQRQILNTLAVSPTITIYDNQVSQVTTAKSLGEPSITNSIGAVTSRNQQKLSNYDADIGRLFWKNLASQPVYESLHGLTPDYLCSKFERRETANNLRNFENKLNVPMPHTNSYKNSFSYSGATLWNRLLVILDKRSPLGYLSV